MNLTLALAPPEPALRGDLESLLGWLLTWLSGHGSHVSLEHAATNLVGLAVLWAWLPGTHGDRFWLLVCQAMLLSVALIVWNATTSQSTVTHYCGLSGILHGLAVIALSCQRVRLGRWCFLLAALILSKVLVDPWLVRSIEGPVESAVVLGVAHTLGAACGALQSILSGKTTHRAGANEGDHLLYG
ncbi:MAG: hypothetical protein AAF648_10400 [Pseudomonadota bacterium]